MGECINESTFRDWQNDPRKLGDPIKPIEVSCLYIALSFFDSVELIPSSHARSGLAKQFLRSQAQAGSHRLHTAETRVRTWYWGRFLIDWSLPFQYYIFICCIFIHLSVTDII
jgi:hypothetical protein